MRIESFLRLGIAVLAVLGVSSVSAAEEKGLIIFHSPSCHNCIEVKKKVMPTIEAEYKDVLPIRYLDINDMANYLKLTSLKQQYSVQLDTGMPVLFLNGHFINGKNVTLAKMRAFINEFSADVAQSHVGQAENVLLKQFVSFTPFAVTAAGLVDGINPCAFTVIVFFISFLALQGYRRRDIVAIGAAFIFAVFLTYLLIGLGVFNVFYELSAFWLVAKIINIAIGILTVVLGCLAVYDLVRYKKTGSTDGLVLQLPQAVKNRIHAVIGWHYRKKKGDQQGPERAHIVKLILSALITGFLVSLLEAVCTGQVYLPTITFVLKSSPLKIQAFGYLLLYNVMFVVPLFAIFLLAIFGATSADFSNFLRKHMVTVKVLMAIVFFGLGLFLIWRG